ncbi:hypothetical protein BASA81_000678 [Batrachochytrium salamandrivorans]|nr:hypothetical protein BASA81_000678 [Batrachochytrium salamandrivorans]
MEPRSISFLVQNLPVEWTEAKVAEHFSAYGCLLSSSLFLLQRPITWNGRKIDVQFLERGIPLGLGGRANQAVSFALPPRSFSPPAVLTNGSARPTPPLSARRHSMPLVLPKMAAHALVDDSAEEAVAPAAAAAASTDAPKESAEQQVLAAPQKVWGKTPSPLALAPVSQFEFPELPTRQRNVAQQRHFARPANAFAAGAAAALTRFDVAKPPVRLNTYPELWYVRHASCTVLELETKLFGTLKHNDFWIREQRNRGGFIDFFSRLQRDEAYALLTRGLSPAKGLLDFGVWQRHKAGKLSVAPAAAPAAVVVVIDPFPHFLPLSQLAQALQQFGRVVDVYLATKRGKDMGLAKLTIKSNKGEVLEVGPYPHFLGVGHATAGKDVEHAEFIKLPAQQFDSVVAMCRFANPHQAEMACAQSFQVGQDVWIQPKLYC